MKVNDIVCMSNISKKLLNIKSNKYVNPLNLDGCETIQWVYQGHKIGTTLLYLCMSSVEAKLSLFNI